MKNANLSVRNRVLMESIRERNQIIVNALCRNKSKSLSLRPSLSKRQKTRGRVAELPRYMQARVGEEACSLDSG